MNSFIRFQSYRDIQDPRSIHEQNKMIDTIERLMEQLQFKDEELKWVKKNIQTLELRIEEEEVEKNILIKENIELRAYVADLKSQRLSESTRESKSHSNERVLRFQTSSLLYQPSQQSSPVPSIQCSPETLKTKNQVYYNCEIVDSVKVSSFFELGPIELEEDLITSCPIIVKPSKLERERSKVLCVFFRLIDQSRLLSYLLTCIDLLPCGMESSIFSINI